MYRATTFIRTGGTLVEKAKFEAVEVSNLSATGFPFQQVVEIVNRHFGTEETEIVYATENLLDSVCNFSVRKFDVLIGMVTVEWVDG